MKVIDFFFDIYSPYAYLAAHRLIEIETANKAKLNYLPIELGRIKKAAGNTGPANIDIPPKIKYLMADLQRWAKLYALPFGMIKGNKTNRVNKGVFYAVEKGVASQYVMAAYKLVWGEGNDPDNDDILKTLAKTVGFDVDSFMAYIDSPEGNTLYEKTNVDAIERGVFGVPTMICDDQMWWGNDRLDFVELYLQ